MSTIPENLKYTSSHEWVKTEDAQTVTVGITEHAQDLLGDLVYVELPEVGAQVSKGQEIAVVESVKAASDVYSPLSGEIIEVNSELGSSPELVNQGPYQQGWLFKLKISNTAELAELLDAKAYATAIEAEGH